MRKAIHAAAAILMGLFLLFSSGIKPLYAEETADPEEITYVYDEANIFSQDQETFLNSLAQDITRVYGYAPYVVSVENWKEYGGSTISECADEIYANNDFGYGSDLKGIVFLFDTTSLEYALSSNGASGWQIQSQDSLDLLLSVIADDYQDDGWYGSSLGFLNKTAQILQEDVSPSDSAGDPQTSTIFVYDLAGLLNTDQVSELDQKAAEVAEKYHFTPYIVTVENWQSYGGSDVLNCAEKIFKENDFGYGSGKDGILLLMSMADREYALYSYGPISDEAMTEYALDQLEPVFLDNFKKDDWYGGFSDYLSETARFLQLAQDGSPVKKKPGLVEWSIVLGVPAIVALIVCIIARLSMRSVVAGSASQYMNANGLVLTNSQDIYTHTTRVRHKIETKSSSSSGSISSGHGSSGHF